MIAHCNPNNLLPWGRRFINHCEEERMNKSTVWGWQCSTMGCLIEDKNSKSKKGNNFERTHFELSPVTLRILLWIVNTHSEFQVNTFSNNRGITKCQSFCMTTSEAKAIAIPRLFSENSQAKNAVTRSFSFLLQCFRVLTAVSPFNNHVF